MHILITPTQEVHIYKYITILGSAGQIAQRLTATLLTYTDMHITLYGRQLSTRVHPEILEHERITVIEGFFQNPKKLEEAVKNTEVVFLSAMETGSDMAAIVKALSRQNIRRIIGLSIAGLSGEFPKELEKWIFDNLPISYVQGERQARNVLRESNLNYTILRLPWLYNDMENTNYELIPEGAPFNDAQVTREAVVKAVYDILHVEDETPFSRASIGVGEPGTHYDKPSFLQDSKTIFLFLS